MPRENDAPPDVSPVSGRRADVLSLLAERSGECATGERALAAELGVSRSAADRAVRHLESSGLVRRAGGRIELTLAGRLAFEAYRRFGAETAAVRTFGDLLRELPSDADIDHDLLDGATAYRSEPPTTGRPADAVTDLIGRARSLLACASAISDSEASARLYRLVVEREGHASVVYTADLADHLREWYLGRRREMATTGRYRAYETDELSYDLFVVESADTARVVVVVYDDRGRLAGAIVNDSDAAVAWGRATFERRRNEATEFTDDLLRSDEHGG
jgi:predicted transcriptional regulator